MNRYITLFLSIYLFSSFTFLLCDTHTSKQDIMIPVYVYENCTTALIPLETYVTGVVTSEMPSSFHIEALKAQAVASRTYAVSKVKSGSNPPEHPLAPLCNSTHCQVYNPYKSKHKDYKKIKKAVRETASQLLYYNNELVENALYHASSGGRTENSEDVFVSALPYLQSVESPYDENIPRNGHGVGMSQHGANGMANSGFDYKKILSHYYSGTVVY